MSEPLKIGLALGAGGARGMAHIGVLKALEASGIEISCIVGSSIGSLIGAGYAAAGAAAELERKLMDFLSSDLYRDSGIGLVRDVYDESLDSWTQRIEIWIKRAYLQAKFVARPAVLDSDMFRKIVAHFIPNVNIEDLPIPFWAMGTDLCSGRSVVFKTGNLRAAIYASMAIPGVVNPMLINDLVVVDGGVLTMLPVFPARHMEPDVVLAVDVDRPIECDEEYATAMDILFRVEDIQNYYLKELHAREADLVLRPNVGHIHWSEFKRAEETIRLGRDEAFRVMDDIRALAGRRKKFWSRRPPPPPIPARDWIVI